MPKRLSGPVGIAHTRLATHGGPSDANAHPHVDPEGRVAVVHNGIIEDAPRLRSKLEAEGALFASETDTEVLAHLIAREEVDDLAEAVRRALSKVHGAYGLAVLDARQPDRLVLARNGSPVLIGIGDRQMLAASDISALVRHAGQVVYLEDGEVATVTADAFTTTTLDARPTAKTPATVSWGTDDYDRGGYDHFMRKEIFEQPAAIDATLRGRLDARFSTAHLGGLNLSARELRALGRVHMLGAGPAPAHGTRPTARPRGRGPRAGGQHRGSGHRDQPRPERVLCRTGARLPGGARRRAEAQGDLLRTRRGLRRGRAQARAPGPDRP